MANRWTGAGVGVAGFGMATVLAILQLGGVTLPGWLFVSLLVPSCLMIVAGVGMVAVPHLPRILRVAGLSSPLVSIEPAATGMSAHLTVTNIGPRSTFEVAVEAIEGARMHPPELALPYNAPWLGPNEFISANENLSERRQRVLLTGASATAQIVWLNARQTNAPHHLFDVLSCEHVGRWFISAQDDDSPEIRFTISVLSEGPPERGRYRLNVTDGSLTFVRES